MTAGSRIVTDDRPFLEFTTPRYYSAQIHCEILNEILPYRADAARRLMAGLRAEPGVADRDVQRRFEYVFDRSSKRLAGQAARVGQSFIAGIRNMWDGNLPEAIGLFERAVARNPKDPEAHCYLAVAYGMAGDAPRASAQFQSAVALDPDMEEAYAGMARLALAGGRLDEAFGCAKKAAEINPWVCEPHDILATVYSTQRLLVKAEEEFLLALSADPRDPVAREGLRILKSAATQLRQRAAAQTQQPAPAPKKAPTKPRKK